MKILPILPALLVFGFIGWIIVQANNGRSSLFFDLVLYIPYGDKLGHFILYGLLSVLTDIALNHKCWLVRNYRIPIGAIIVLVLAIAEEMTQLFLSTRTFDVLDILADMAGIYLFILLFNNNSNRFYSNQNT